MRALCAARRQHACRRSAPPAVGQVFDDMESDLASEYDEVRGKSRLEWDDARHATRAAWNRLDSPLRND
jgi:hypothetical protein